MFLGCIHWSGENNKLLREVSFGDLVNQQCSLLFWFLPELFSTNVDLLGPQLFQFHQACNAKTANIYHCSDFPHCTRKTADNFPPFSSQSKAFYPNLLQSTVSPLPVFYFVLQFTLHQIFTLWLTLPTPHPVSSSILTSMLYLELELTIYHFLSIKSLFKQKYSYKS